MDYLLEKEQNIFSVEKIKNEVDFINNKREGNEKVV